MKWNYVAHVLPRGGGSRSALGPVIGLPFGKEKLEGVGGGVEGQTDRWRLID